MSRSVMPAGAPLVPGRGWRSPRLRFVEGPDPSGAPGDGAVKPNPGGDGAAGGDEKLGEAGMKALAAERARAAAAEKQVRELTAKLAATARKPVVKGKDGAGGEPGADAGKTGRRGLRLRPGTGADRPDFPVQPAAAHSGGGRRPVRVGRAAGPVTHLPRQCATHPGVDVR